MTAMSTQLEICLSELKANRHWPYRGGVEGLLREADRKNMAPRLKNQIPRLSSQNVNGLDQQLGLCHWLWPSLQTMPASPTSHISRASQHWLSTEIASRSTTHRSGEDFPIPSSMWFALPSPNCASFRDTIGLSGRLYDRLFTSATCPKGSI